MKNNEENKENLNVNLKTFKELFSDELFNLNNMVKQDVLLLEILEVAKNLPNDSKFGAEVRRLINKFNDDK
jgi:hypothetical protein